MLAVTLALLAQSACPLQLSNGQAMEPIMALPVFCDVTNVAQQEAIAEIFTAPPGGRWWLARTDDDGVQRVTGSGPFIVVDGGGEQLAISDVYVTPAAVSLAVPTTAGAGAVLQLMDNGSVVSGVLLRVGTSGSDGDAPPVAFSVDTVDVVGTVPQACEVSCRFDGMTVPAAPLLQVGYTGGPAILDAWAVTEGSFIEELSPRTIDSQLLVASDGAVTVDRRLNEVGFTTNLDVRVRAMDPDSLEVLYDAVHVIAALPEVPVEEVADVPPCGESGLDPEPPFGCTAGPTPLDVTSLLGSLLLLGAVRRRRAKAR